MRTSLEKNGIWLTAWGALVLTALLTRPPLPVDETRYLSVAWEMWQQQHILVPISNGAPYSHKPPLLFWLMQASVMSCLICLYKSGIVSKNRADYAQDQVPVFTQSRGA